MPEKKYRGRVLLVDDDINTQKFWEVVFSKHNFRIDVCQTLAEMRDYLDRYFIDFILLDLNLENESGLDGISHIIKYSPYSKIFILTAEGSIDTAIKSIKLGVTDYFMKDTDPKALLEKINSFRVDNKNNIENFSDMNFVGVSESYLSLCSKINQIKNVDSTILILGESGTGKEVVARAIHNTSSRSDQRFEAINCGAIPGQLLESELFGHTKGAFTDAKSDRKGIFELCSEGTLLLDEIGDMPISLQVKLLRVLQEREVTPVGAPKPLKVNTRIFAATHRDLKKEVELGNFREDLFYRLSVVPMKIPPLRERKDDFAILVNEFILSFNKRFDKNIKPVSIEVLEKLKAHDWPGNIRELKNAVERAVVLSTNDQINIEALLSQVNEHPKKVESSPQGLLDEKIFDTTLTEAKHVFEKKYIERLLENTNGNITEVAKLSGRYRADIYRLFEKYQIDHNLYR